MWEAIQYVGSPLALAAYVAAVIATVLRARIRQRVQLLQTLPEKERADYLTQSLETYRIQHDNLTRQQKHELMLEVLRQRAVRLKIISLTAIAITAILAAAVVTSIFVVQHRGTIIVTATGDTSPIITIQDSPGASVEIPNKSASDAKVDEIIKELGLLLHDRAREAFTPISFALHDKQYRFDRDKVLEFKKKWVNLEIDLNKAIVDKRFALALNTAQELKKHGSSDVADWISYDHGPTPTGYMFKKLPAALVSGLHEHVPELDEFVELFEF